MIKRSRLLLIGFILFCACNGWAESEDSNPSGCMYLKNTLFSDFKNFYSLKNQANVGIGIALSGILANTSSDENFQDWVQDSVVNEDTNNFSDAVKEMGSWTKVAPVYLGLWGVGSLLKNTRIGNETRSFSSETARGLFVGMPSVLLWQFVLGASRPSDEGDSKWHPFEDNNSASGHTFTGAVPFLTAARRTDNIYLKSLFYLGSTFTGYSRINDHQHYLSQTILGWWLAYSAVESIHKTENSKVAITPFPMDDGLGFYFTFRF